ncbi:hypothetical protein OG693_39815 (plasmid) [Streptomyces sp. NBC_01259]|uniref:hypothetical protein n=1 Tax=Streptomyces sp. NBC_01259 TaxID=2903800 RepID=UPI002F9186C2
MNDEQAGGLDEHGDITRAKAPVSGVSVPAHMGIGSDLVDGIDYVVLLQVLFDVSSATEVTPVKVWERLKARGIRSTKNREELVGKNSVYESFNRIIDAGYLLRVELPNEKRPGRKGRIAYKLYDNPAWNPAWQARQVGSDPLITPNEAPTKPQVRTLPGTRELVNREVDNADKAAGQNTSRNQGTGVTGSLVPGSGGRRIPAGQNASPVPERIKASPPHPPEEVTTSSPTPHAHTDGRTSLPSQTEGGREFSPKEIHAAESFLQRMASPWNAGKATATKCAPKLLHVMAEQGWPSIFDVDRRVLERDITKNPGGITRHAQVLPGRIADLSLYEVVAPACRQAPAPRSNEPERGPVSTESITSLLDGLQSPSI